MLSFFTLDLIRPTLRLDDTASTVGWPVLHTKNKLAVTVTWNIDADHPWWRLTPCFKMPLFINCFNLYKKNG